MNTGQKKVIFDSPVINTKSHFKTKWLIWMTDQFNLCKTALPELIQIIWIPAQQIALVNSTEPVKQAVDLRSHIGGFSSQQCRCFWYNVWGTRRDWLCTNQQLPALPPCLLSPSDLTGGVFRWVWLFYWIEPPIEYRSPDVKATPPGS